ncbi:hypothetical protein CEP88_06770 [Roseobacter denitrificans]|uniref:Uncharacterized protein n=1 Tax=Roseobacter denitrificans (strain ATCC 33942 / OCh 114) TaxID=375451 RepID=Q163B1_ROSDO|nr:hypothetical protein [Roseobacter denitrificans]ABG32932.1 hypothetical protein RD1_3442 [Roseobacter denitrificans OCh 114]AVL52323.1 hypothetical protein CEP88_06770 [Roseobacter denitrificans]SFG46162.1 hypothetical protein SAMN05443635_11961 [Roseobacter denitrificans OCh 114]
MFSADFLVNIVLPIALVFLSFFTPLIARAAERMEKLAKQRAEHIEHYHSHAMRFMELTDVRRDAKIREAVFSTGEFMMQGTKLIRTVIGFRYNNDNDNEAVMQRQSKIEIETLSDDAVDELGRAFANALIVSTYQSFWLGGVYRSILRLLFSENDPELKRPERIVYRLPRFATKSFMKENNSAFVG